MCQGSLENKHNVAISYMKFARRLASELINGDFSAWATALRHERSTFNGKERINEKLCGISITTKKCIGITNLREEDLYSQRL